ncbi:SusC/RagA family TonB-linked outer membrane protein [Niastella yeongjuensis]|uniref:SusC/RagA family TonB-linked outer membrane protein n=1 Tax=Niastella yeongjuensis TaxID=354355 RepID=A0A1V9EEI2_9BACT|nr:TonB-dependent receptor [Niastella yeongjuensis]OQP44533.1 SusC/RagA family TonB-linked outer membrane protein [Niastella yeongjuensis]SEO84415.1 TonB-linked outer membrane protein, SusC/RagA family [Niastella yeongjuensis]
MRQFLQLTIRAACSPFYRTAPPLILLTCLLFTQLTLLAQMPVQGRVLTGDGPLSGVSVTIKGTQTTTVTDAEGKFSIQAPEKAILVFTHVNYKAREAAVTGGNMEITLSPANNSMSEVIVIGYNTQKKATLTGSVSAVKGADLVKSPQANVSNSLAGRFSGVILNNRSGEPGYDGSGITVRGLATTGNNDVLVVVDGVPGQIGGMERLNPNDIESISVLKDASAAIYGSRAANGVILVTTKRGRTGKPSISVNYNHGISSPTRLPKMADAKTYAQISNEIAYYNSQAGGMNQQYSAAEIQKFADGSDPLNYPNTDWAKTTLKNSTGQDQANVSIAGGSDNIRYYLSAGLLAQDGLYKNGATKYNQYSFRSNIDASITKDFKVSLYLSGREEDRQFPAASASDIFRSIYRAYSTIPAFYPNGLPSYGIEGNNPAMMATSVGGLNKNPGQVFNGILKSSYNIAAIKGLSVDAFAAVDRSWYFYKTFATPYLLYLYDKTSDTYNPRMVGGNNNAPSLNEGQKNQTQLTTNIRLNYANSFGLHNISAFVGYEQSELKRDSVGASRINFPTSQTPELSQGGTAATDRDNGGNSFNYTRKSYLGKLSYNYAEKYLFDAQMRIDGSSTFPSNNRYGYFPSFSAGWRISNESFLHNVSFINDLKIRASYGMLGNDSVAMFQYLNNYSFNSQVVLGSGITPAIDLTKLGNKQIHWEEARKTDIAVEGTLFNDINFEFIYFSQHRTNILAVRNASVPNVTGIVNPFGSSPLIPSENIGKVNSNGFEATLGYNNRKGKLHYGASGNFTYAKSKIIFIDEAPAVLSYQKQTGRPLNTYLLYNATGIFHSTDEVAKFTHLDKAQPGDLILQDYNNDDKIDANDQIRTKYGNVPEITYGILLNADYKSFDISVVFAGQTHVSQFVLPESGTVGNFYSSWADNRWSPTNPNGTYPRVETRTSASVNGGLYPNTFWLNNASFLRLKNIELGYNVTTTALSKMKMQSLRVYLSAFNLFTITKVKDYDPEGSNYSGQFYPQQRIVNLGVALQF